jgi:hypothetical protein
MISGERCVSGVSVNVYTTASNCVPKIPQADVRISAQQNTVSGPSVPGVDSTTDQASTRQGNQSNTMKPTPETSNDRPIASRTRRGLQNLKALGDQLPEPHSLNCSVGFAPASALISLRSMCITKSRLLLAPQAA